MDKEISVFYYYAFHETFTTSENLAVASEIERLCHWIELSPYAREFAHELNELEKMISYVCQNNVGHSVSLVEVHKKIANLQIKEKLFLGAFLTAELNHNKNYGEENNLSLTERKRINDTYRPLLMICAFRVLESQGFDPNVKKACAEIRLITTGFARKNYYLSDCLKSHSLSQLVCLIGMNISNSHKDHSSRLGGIYSLVKLASETIENKIDLNNKIFVFNQSHKKTTLIQKRQQSEQRLFKKVNGIKAEITHSPQAQGKDNLNDDVSSLTAEGDSLRLKFVNKRKKPTATSQEQANAISKRISSSKRRLPADINQASERDIQLLITTVLEYIENKSSDEEAAKLLLLSLLLGVNFDKLRYCEFEVHQKYCTVTYDLKLQSYHAVSNHKESYNIYLPHCLAGILYDISFSVMSFQESARQIITQLNKGHNSKLSLGKISGFIDTHLLSSGVDRTIISLLTNPKPSHQMSLNYVSIEQSVINKQFIAYVEFLRSLVDGETHLLSIVQPDNDVAVIGSKVNVTDDELKYLLERLSKQLKQQNTKHKRYTDDFHNLYSLYTYLLLTLASGYRPVNETLGYLSSYQVSLGIVHIIDKEKSQKNEGRQVYLCSIVQQQLLYYLDYCHYRHHYFRITNPRLAKRYQRTLTNEAPLLFFKGIEDGYSPANQKYLAELFSQFDLSLFRYDAEAERTVTVNLPLNWHRHYLRSFLLKASLKPEAVITEEKSNAWMGHDGQENDIPFSRFSHLSITDLKAVAHVLNDHLDTLGITAIEVR